MASKKIKKEIAIEEFDFSDNTKTHNSKQTLEELIFSNVDYTDIEKLKKLRRLNELKQEDILNKLKECLNIAI